MYDKNIEINTSLRMKTSCVIVLSALAVM